MYVCMYVCGRCASFLVVHFCALTHSPDVNLLSSSSSSSCVVCFSCAVSVCRQIPPAAVELVCQEEDSLGIPQTLEDDDVSLAYYGVFDGSTIVVHNAEDNKKKGGDAASGR